MIEDHLEAVGGGQATLIAPPGRIVQTLADLERSTTSWVMVTPGRIHPWALANMTRNEVAQAGVRDRPAHIYGDGRRRCPVGPFWPGPLPDGRRVRRRGTVLPPIWGARRTLAQYMAIMLPITPTYYAVRHGYTTPGVGAPATVDIGDGAESVLDACRWLAKSVQCQLAGSWSTGCLLTRGR